MGFSLVHVVHWPLAGGFFRLLPLQLRFMLKTRSFLMIDDHNPNASDSRAFLTFAMRLRVAMWFIDFAHRKRSFRSRFFFSLKAISSTSFFFNFAKASSSASNASCAQSV